MEPIKLSGHIVSQGLNSHLAGRVSIAGVASGLTLFIHSIAYSVYGAARSLLASL